MFTPPIEIAANLDPHPVVQQNYFNFIIRYYELNHTGPSPEEVREGMSAFFSRPLSKHTIYHHLLELSKHGKIDVIQRKNPRVVKIIVRDARWQYVGANKITGWKGSKRANVRRSTYLRKDDPVTVVRIEIPNYVNREEWLEYCLKKII